MPFKISFANEPNSYTDKDSTWAIGQIVAGELDEEFHADLGQWDKQEYESQWLHSLEAFLEGDQKAVLFTNCVNQKGRVDLEWWALYRDGDTVHVQNHLPFRRFDRPFSVANASNFLQDRTTVTEDGDRISEWDIPLTAIELFVKHLKKQERK